MPNIPEIKARYAAAIPEPWTLRREDDGGPNVDVMSGKTVIAAMGDFYPEAEFIANARTDIPALVEALEEAQKKREQTMTLLRTRSVNKAPGICKAIEDIWGESE